MKKIDDEVQRVGERIATQTCVLEIHVRQPGFKKKMNSSYFLTRSGNALGIHPDVLTVSKDLIERRDIAYLDQHRTAFLNSIRAYSVYGGGLTLGNGQYLVPLECVEEIKAKIVTYQSEREQLLNKFELDYDNLKEKARQRQGGFFNALEYPRFNQIRSRYTVDYKFISNSIPEELKKLNARIARDEQNRLRLETQQLARELPMIMRETFLQLLEGLTEKLRRDPITGEFKSLPQARVTQLLEFIDKFNSKNLVGDKDLKQLVDQARDVLGNVAIRKLVTNEELRDKVSEVFTEIQSETEELVKTQSRAIDLSKL